MSEEQKQVSATDKKKWTAPTVLRRHKLDRTQGGAVTNTVENTSYTPS